MRKVCFFTAALMVMTFGFLSAQIQLFNQPYDVTGSGYTSTMDSEYPVDYEVADDFSGVNMPFNKIVFYGLAANFVSGWVPTVPAAVEPFYVRFYELEQGWTQPPVADPGIMAPTTGTYTIRMYDTYGDGWNGGMLDVYVDGVQVLNDITLASGAGPLDHTFAANAGQYILTVYTAGGWSYENWYEILDPALAVIATDGPDPTGIGVLPTPPLLAPVTGTYTVNLYDTYGDGWNGGMLDVYVNNVLVLDGITLATGAGPATFTFAANAGEVIATVYTPGNWAYENWYEILDPALAAIATDGPTGSGPTGIGFVSTYVTYEPEWTNPMYDFSLNATTTLVGPSWGDWVIYKYEADLPAEIAMSDGWMSVQINADAGSGVWYLWQASTTGDGLSYQRMGSAGKGKFVPLNNANGKEPLEDDLSFELWYDEPQVPVELSSFSATITAENTVNLTWVTQTETGVMGYYLYRNNGDDLDNSLLVSSLIQGTNSSESHTYNFTDSEISESGTYFYWLQNVDYNGNMDFHGPVSVVFNSPESNTPVLPTVTELKSVYPNPFKAGAKIPFNLAKAANVNVKIYNSRGQLLRHFDLATKAPGSYQVNWDGKDALGRDCGNGVYYFVMQADEATYSCKAIMMK